MTVFAFRAGVMAICLVAGAFAEERPSSSAEAASRRGKAAAAYLDGRLTWWIGWPSAARDHETFCISCHTVLPYAMARPALRAALDEQDISPPERRLLANVIKRVQMWNEVAPFYPDKKEGDPKTAESRGTESIVNALILARYDAPKGSLSRDARVAFENMWAQQLKTGETKGAWSWLQFHNAPWEGDSQYYGTTLAAIAVGIAPGNYRSAPEIQDGLQLLREYLVRERESQNLINRVILLWASARVPGLLTGAQQKSIIEEAFSKQQADGGFSLSAFIGSWKRRDNTPLETKSDGYATGVVAFALKQAGVPPNQPNLKRALIWLRENQDTKEGRWLAYSPNKQRDLSSDIGRFMSDAATAYAVLALKATDEPNNRSLAVTAR
jgi:squalene-hopene/tetraprenyl-beta-curcumene cyclase